MFSIINLYCEWNCALWKYFFPTKEDNAILYLDDNILAQVAELQGIRQIGEMSWEQQFLSCTLLHHQSFDEFKANWGARTGDRTTTVPQARTWDRLVEKLMPLQLDGYPAYFAMLCAIMLLAGIQGANHKKIQDGARKYLGSEYSSSPGMLIDPLLQQLHKDHPSFNPNRMICGTQRHMSRIKYHLVLKKDMRDDFIDFIEINNLQWQYESYSFYIDNILVPALEKGGKSELARIITKEENIPYVKNLLRGKLLFGKPSSNRGNVIQEKTINWYYELSFDFDGSYSFNIICDYVPFHLSFKDSEFIISDESSSSGYVSNNVQFSVLQGQYFSYKGSQYRICNISDRVAGYGNRFYFERIAEDIYRQVESPKSGQEYYIFIKKTARLRPYETGWDFAPDIQDANYNVYSVPSFATPHAEGRDRIVTEDRFQLRGLGTWFSIVLKDNQVLNWRPNIVGSAFKTLSDIIKGSDGKTYFRLPRTSIDHLSGDLVVREGDKDLMSEQIISEFEWHGLQTNYHMNGWGEITDTPISEQPIKMIISGQQILQNNLESKSIGSDILLQVLFDLADSSGCVSERKMRAAIEFALSFYGIIPTESNRKSVLYALRRLGYIIAYYDINRKEYVNQLISKYIERSNYSLQGLRNAYVVKGVYSQTDLDSLFSDINYIYRKRPYENDVLNNNPEYACLPDIILFEPSDNTPWRKIDYPMADYLISHMEDMKRIDSRYCLNSGGEAFFGHPQEPTPCIIKGSNGEELLCTKNSRGEYVTHKYYTDNDKLRLLPKHIARIFCQNAKNLPVCLMEWRNSDINYARVSFISGMGLPEVLDVALCDMSLGMPNIEDVFIVDQKEALGVNTRFPIMKKKSYFTTATSSNYQYLKGAITKLSGRSVSDFRSAPSVIFLYRVNRWYKIKYTKDYSGHQSLISLLYGDDLIAFSLGSKVYYRASGVDEFYTIEGGDINTVFSKIINGNRSFQRLQKFTGEIPTHPDRPGTFRIPVLEKLTLK